MLWEKLFRLSVGRIHRESKPKTIKSNVWALLAALSEVIPNELLAAQIFLHKIPLQQDLTQKDKFIYPSIMSSLYSSSSGFQKSVDAIIKSSDWTLLDEFLYQTSEENLSALSSQKRSINE